MLIVTFTSDDNDINGDEKLSSSMSLFKISEVTPEHPLKGYVPSISILPGLLFSPMVIVVIPVQLVKAPVFTVVNVLGI